VWASIANYTGGDTGPTTGALGQYKNCVTTIRDIAQETRIVVLDEADRLFVGFAKETKKILSFLP
jgi:hypothetical protein